jgi:futalosine hydrolase
LFEWQTLSFVYLPVLKEPLNILIVSATEAEVMPLLKELSFRKVNDYEFNNLYGTEFSHEIDIELLITGIGMTATAFHLGRILDDNYDLVLNAGLAGSFNRNLDLGTVVNITEDHFADLGAEDGDGFLTLKEMKLEGAQSFLNNAALNNRVLDLLPKVNGITVNTVHGNEQSIEKVFRRFRPMTESMEGAAFLFAAQTAKVPCAQVRAISNFVEVRNRDAWNIPKAVENLNRTLTEIIRAF